MLDEYSFTIKVLHKGCGRVKVLAFYAGTSNNLVGGEYLGSAEKAYSAPFIFAILGMLGGTGMVASGTLLGPVARMNDSYETSRLAIGPAYLMIAAGAIILIASALLISCYVEKAKQEALGELRATVKKIVDSKSAAAVASGAAIAAGIMPFFHPGGITRTTPGAMPATVPLSALPPGTVVNLGGTFVTIGGSAAEANTTTPLLGGGAT